jgi:hypothetical protein
MKRIFTVVLFLAVCAVGFAQERNTVQVQTIDAAGDVKYVSPSNPMPTTLAGTASVSFSIVNSTGILGTATLSIPLTSAVALPTAPTGAKDCFVFPTQDVNWGAANVGSGVDHQYFFQTVPGQGFFGYSSFTSLRLIGRTAVATATLIWR